jgi:hypothetical protein
MSDLSQNINIRTTHQMKKKIMDESHRVTMNMSEYILFSMEDYWGMKDNGTTSQFNNEEQLRLSTLLSTTQSELLMAKNEISQLLTDKNSLTETLHSQKNSIWQEANETALRLSREHIEQEKTLAVQQFREQSMNQIAHSDQQTQWYANRLQQYETDMVKNIFDVTRQHPTLSQEVRDLPDVVHYLAYQFHQQFLNPEANV